MARPTARFRRSVVVAIALSMTVPTATFGGKPAPEPRDITGSDAGVRAADAAAARITDDYGIPTEPSDLRVWQVGDRVLAGPAGSTITVTEIRDKDGGTGIRVSATEPSVADAARTSTPDAPAAAGPGLAGWKLVGDHCWIDLSRESSYMDVCYHKYRATNDGSATHDYFALNMFTTFATPGFGLETGDPWIKAWPSSTSPAATWHDWQPRADRTFCGAVNVGVSVNGFPLSLSGSQCETWDITKYARAGEFRNKWTEGLCQTERGERELEFTVAVRVAQGKVPTWSFDWFEHVQIASCAV
jgi:hypothetical protein